MAFTESLLSLSRDQRPLQPFLASLPCLLNPMLDYLTDGDIRCILLGRILHIPFGACHLLHMESRMRLGLLKRSQVLLDLRARPPDLTANRIFDLEQS